MDESIGTGLTTVSTGDTLCNALVALEYHYCLVMVRPLEQRHVTM